MIGESHPETRPVFERKAAEMQSPIYFADQNYRIEELPHPSLLQAADLRFTVRGLTPGAMQSSMVFSSPLSGSYQLRNIATLFQTLQLFPEVGLTVDWQNISDGIGRVVAVGNSLTVPRLLFARQPIIPTESRRCCRSLHRCRITGCILYMVV